MKAEFFLRPHLILSTDTASDGVVPVDDTRREGMG